MTGSKRWYQLSMLQMLVAMAMTAWLVWLNRPVPCYVHSDLGGMTCVGESQGWPIHFRPFRWRELPVILTPSAEPRAPIASPTRSLAQDIHWLPLLVDTVLGAMMITLAVFIVGLFGKRKAS